MQNHESQEAPPGKAPKTYTKKSASEWYFTVISLRPDRDTTEIIFPAYGVLAPYTRHGSPVHTLTHTNTKQVILRKEYSEQPIKKNFPSQENEKPLLQSSFNSNH